jgi:hypothetical protein
MTITKSITYGISEGNRIAVCGEPSDLAAYMKVLESPATAEAMAFDGVLRDTVKVFVLDKEIEVQRELVNSTSGQRGLVRLTPVGRQIRH